MRKVRCSYPLILVIALAVLFDSGGDLVLLAAAAAVHELGHLLCMFLLGAEVRSLRLSVGGMVIDYNGSRLSYLGDAAVALAGPAFSLLTALVLARLGRVAPSDGLFYFAGLNLLLGLFNLVPLLPLDGGRILLCLLCQARGPGDAERICGGVSQLFAWLLLLAGGCLLIVQENPSLLLISLTLLLGTGDKNTLQGAAFGVL